MVLWRLSSLNFEEETGRLETQGKVDLQLDCEGCLEAEFPPPQGTFIFFS